MKKKILLFESRDLCYESNRYFVGCLEEAFEKMGMETEICDLSLHMEQTLEHLLERQEEYLAAFDFNSLLPRLELEDGTAYLEAFQVPFYNCLVDHPLYHHAALKRGFSAYSVICIDEFHCAYVKNYYPHIRQVLHMPLGAMEAEQQRDWEEKRFDLLFLGTYEPEEALYEQLQEYAPEKKREVLALIEMMQADKNLLQEEALERYLHERGEELTKEAFARRLNQDYLADKYLRNQKRKQEVLAAASAHVPFTVMGYGWDGLQELEKNHIALHAGVNFAASIQMVADAKMLLNTTPGFHGALHDRVYSAMINGTVCLTEEDNFSRSKLIHGKNAILYDCEDAGDLAEKLRDFYGQAEKMKGIAEAAREQAKARDTWQHRLEQIWKMI